MLIDGYYSYLEYENRTKKSLEGIYSRIVWSCIITEYCNTRDDYIKLYVRETDNECIITDAGETLKFFNAPLKQAEHVANIYGIQIKQMVLITRSNNDDIKLKIDSIARAIVELDIISYLLKTETNLLNVL